MPLTVALNGQQYIEAAAPFVYGTSTERLDVTADGLEHNPIKMLLPQAMAERYAATHYAGGDDPPEGYYFTRGVETWGSHQ